MRTSFPGQLATHATVGAWRSTPGGLAASAQVVGHPGARVRGRPHLLSPRMYGSSTTSI